MTEPSHLPAWFDRRQRPLRELRVSVTDRCNFRCRYCMPREHFGVNHRFVPLDLILSFEEITRTVSLLHSAGLRKVRLTGGEPLLREELGELVRMLKSLPEIELALTTNGTHLSKVARELRTAGLDRITLSLDALDEDCFQRITDSRHSPKDVLMALESAVVAGFESIKINCVVKRGVNEDQILPLVDYFRHTPHELRFIEFMDTGETAAWTFSDVVTAHEVLARIESRFPLEPVAEASYGQTSRMFRHRGETGRVGVIASVTMPFCSDCTRARLTAKGELFTCLFGAPRVDVRELLRCGASDSEVRESLRQVWAQRADRYSELRGSEANSHAGAPLIAASRLLASPRPRRPDMSYLGG